MTLRRPWITFVLLGLAIGADAAADEQRAPAPRPASTARPAAPVRYRTGPRGAERARIVFLHGLGDHPGTSMGRRLARELDRAGIATDIVAPWLRETEVAEDGWATPTGPHTMSGQLARIRDVLDAADGPVFLVGHSFGGRAALQLRHDPRVLGVIGLAPSVKMVHAYWKEITGERGLPDAATVVRRLRSRADQLRAEWEETGSLRLSSEISYTELMADAASFDEPASELGVTTPTLVFHGAEDRAVSIHYARRFAEQNPGVELVEYPETDHSLIQYRPRTLTLEWDTEPEDTTMRDVARRIGRFIEHHGDRR